jgi:hypothetical protein
VAQPVPANPVRPNLRARLRQIFLYILLIVLGAAALAYGLDFAIFQLRVITKHSPYGAVMVNPYDAIPQKSGKTTFIFDDPRSQACVNALFPHAGALPCWYLRRHTDRRTDF